MEQYEDRHWWFIGRRRIVKSILDRFFKENRSSRILEIGCGTGGNLALLSSYGQLTAVELNDDAIASATQRNVCPVLKGCLPEPLPITGNFDLICMLDVLEHIDKDTDSLAKVTTHMQSDGLLLITVPAYMFLWSSHDDIHHHKRRYTKSQLEKLIGNSGLKVVYSTYFNTLLFPLAYAAKLMNGLGGRNRSLGVALPSAPVNRVLLRIFQLEIPLLKQVSLPFGVSVLIIARKTSTV